LLTIFKTLFHDREYLALFGRNFKLEILAEKKKKMAHEINFFFKNESLFKNENLVQK